MPRYYFNIVRGTIALDPLGTELTNVRDARLEALSRIKAVVDHAAKRQGEAGAWRMEVRDFAGLPVFRVDLAVASASITLGRLAT